VVKGFQVFRLWWYFLPREDLREDFLALGLKAYLPTLKVSLLNTLLNTKRFYSQARFRVLSGTVSDQECCQKPKLANLVYRMPISSSILLKKFIYCYSAEANLMQ